MPHSATLVIGDTYVVLTDVPLLSWDYSAPIQWSPSDLWPSPGHLEQLHERLRRGTPTFVVVGEPLTAGPGRPAPHRLDFLPEPLRQRGLGFLRSSAVQIHDVPLALRPPLLLDQADPAQPNVRFGRWSGMDRAAARSLGAVVRILFPTGDGSAGRRTDNLEYQLATGAFLGADMVTHLTNRPRPETD